MFKVCLFLKKRSFDGEKYNIEQYKSCNFHKNPIINLFYSLFKFLRLKLDFYQNKQNWEHLYVFFVLGVFPNFDVHFWPVLKVENDLSLSKFWQEKNLFKNCIS